MMDVRYCYDEAELAAVLTEFGLTPTPVPTVPFSVRLPDGREMEARHRSPSSDDDGNFDDVTWIPVIVTVGHTHGGLRPGAGRPPSDEPKRDKLLGVKATADEYASVQAAADAAGQTVSDYIRQRIGL